jgi:hypothetical protein
LSSKRIHPVTNPNPRLIIHATLLFVIFLDRVCSLGRGGGLSLTRGRVSPVQSFSGHSPAEPITIFYCLSLDTPPTCRASPQRDRKVWLWVLNILGQTLTAVKITDPFASLRVRHIRIKTFVDQEKVSKNRVMTKTDWPADLILRPGWCLTCH